ncbi:hypothetical protein VP01_889g3 [Puccinia sorghi]|uniref:Uncharacterized protein n=1 Tax=Puccinia sorghi TaxID=27349 RepID=A0A0L6U847_9BASI|nr:hypothetical protein VP01_889g3 [Puccinia sorghi]
MSADNKKNTKQEELGLTFYSKNSSLIEIETIYELIMESDHHLMLRVWQVRSLRLMIVFCSCSLSKPIQYRIPPHFPNKQFCQLLIQITILLHPECGKPLQVPREDGTWVDKAANGVQRMELFANVFIARRRRRNVNNQRQKQYPFVCEKAALNRKGNGKLFDLHCRKNLEELVNNTFEFILSERRSKTGVLQRNKWLSLSIEDVHIVCFILGYRIGGGWWMHLTSLDVHFHFFIFNFFILTQLTTFHLRQLEFLYLLSSIRIDLFPQILLKPIPHLEAGTIRASISCTRPTSKNFTSHFHIFFVLEGEKASFAQCLPNLCGNAN